MQISLTAIRTSWAFRLTSWLLLAAIAAGLTFLVWIAAEVKPVKTKAQKNADNPVVVEPAALLANHPPAETKEMVQPIKFDAVIRDMRNYPKEFKDSHFIKANTGKWALQVMNVVENDVITDYLNGRETDRDKFNYFRVIDQSGQKRFILTYGVFNTSQEAQTAAKTVDFNLPSNVTVFPEQFKLYEGQMDDYEVSPPLRDVGKDAPRDVKLKSTQKPLPAPKAKPSPKKSDEQAQANTEKKPAKPATSNADTSTSDSKPKRSIEKSTNKADTLSIQEGHAPAERPRPASEEMPLRPQRSEPPAMNEDKKPTADRPERKAAPSVPATPKERPERQTAPSATAAPPKDHPADSAN